MLTPNKKAALENAADLLEELGHAGAQPLRELIRDNRLETLMTFLLYGGAVTLTRSETSGVGIEVAFGPYTYMSDIVVEHLRASGVVAMLSVADQVIESIERQCERPVCNRGDNPLAECLAVLDTTVARGCPHCGSTVMPTFDPVALMMTCNACGVQMQVSPAES